MAKRKPRVRNSANFTTLKQDFEHPKGRSMTIQGESYTIQELLEQHVQGTLDPSFRKDGIFNPDPSHEDPDFQKLLALDLAELEEINQNNSELLKEMQLKIKKLEEKELNALNSSNKSSRDEQGDKLEPEANKAGNAVDSSKAEG